MVVRSFDFSLRLFSNYLFTRLGIYLAGGAAEFIWLTTRLLKIQLSFCYDKDSWYKPVEKSSLKFMIMSM